MSPIPPSQPYPPTSALVAVSWLAQRVTGLDAQMVATTLPRDVNRWAAAGFVQATVISGRPDIDVPIRRPLVQIDAWAVNVDASGNVMPSRAIAKANRLAELVRLATEDPQTYGRPVTLPTGYAGARVLSVYPLGEPAEVPDDEGGYARVTMDLAFDWTRV